MQTAALCHAPPRSDRTGTAPPAPVVVAPPVLLSDCVTPLGGATLLGRLLRRAAGDG